MRRPFFASAVSFAFFVVACGSASTGTTPLPVTDPDSGASTNPSGGDSGSSPEAGDDDGGAVVTDAGTDSGHHYGGDAGNGDPGVDASYPVDPVDGDPTRQVCTGTFGSGLSAVHGRLDGTLVSIIPPGTGYKCNGDSDHLHLQILMGGSIYDVAANLDTLVLEKDMAMPTSDPFTEGWHTADGLDYPTIGLHNTDFTLPATQAALASLLESALENSNHLSVYATGYGPDGIHDVHRRGTAAAGSDGAIVIDPLSATPHIFYFCFDTDTF